MNICFIHAPTSRVNAVIATLGGLVTILSGCFGDVPVRVTGTVVDAEGNPVVGARARLTNEDGEDVRPFPSITDESGRFAIYTTRSSTGITFGVVVDADGYLRKEATFESSGEMTVLNFELEREDDEHPVLKNHTPEDPQPE